MLAGTDCRPSGPRARPSFARAIGRAYQLHNDLLDLSVPAHDGCDLVQGKRTVTLMRARAADDRTTAAGRQFDRPPRATSATANGHAVQLAETLRQQDVFDTDALDADPPVDRRPVGRRPCRSRRPAPLSPNLSAHLTGLADALDATYFAVPAGVPTMAVTSRLTGEPARRGVACETCRSPSDAASFGSPAKRGRVARD